MYTRGKSPLHIGVPKGAPLQPNPMRFYEPQNHSTQGQGMFCSTAKVWRHTKPPVRAMRPDTRQIFLHAKILALLTRWRLSNDDRHPKKFRPPITVTG